MSVVFPKHVGGITELLALSLAEDIGGGDVTTSSTVPAGLRARAVVRACEPCVLAGLAVFDELAEAMAVRGRAEEEAESLKMTQSIGDGSHVRSATDVCTIEGTARALLTIERTFLNFLGRMSGIATLTASYVDAVERAGGGVRVLDTRKTTPGHRVLEKYAVRCGGGFNHRMGLYDAILIKDNHVVAAGGIERAVAQALAHAPAGLPVEVECDTREQVTEALRLSARAVLLDNFAPADVAEVVREVAGRARVEVSGGVTLDTIGAYVRARPDDISVGRLTHGARSTDLSMRIELLR